MQPACRTNPLYYLARFTCATLTGVASDLLATVLPNCFGLNVTQLRTQLAEKGCALLGKTAENISSCFNQLKSFAITEPVNTPTPSYSLFCIKKIEEFDYKSISDACVCAFQKAAETIPLDQLVLQMYLPETQTSSFTNSDYSRFTTIICTLTIFDIAVERLGLSLNTSTCLGLGAAFVLGPQLGLSSLGTSLSYLSYRLLNHFAAKLVRAGENPPPLNLAAGELALLHNADPV